MELQLQLGFLAFGVLLGVTAFIAARWRRALGPLLLLAFLAYGLLAGLLTVAWQNAGGDTPYLPNIPGQLLGDEAYHRALNLDDPRAQRPPEAIPWLLRPPQVYVPASVAFWGGVGLLGWLALRQARRGRRVLP